MENTYVPAVGIVPIPMFRDYAREDPNNKLLSYRTKDSHTSGPNIQSSTLKTVNISPASPSNVAGRAQREYDGKWHKLDRNPEKRKYRRLSKTKRKSWKSVNMPMVWNFSTVANRMTE